MIVYLNGHYLDAKQAAISPLDPGFLYGDGIFETLRTYKGKVWQMDKHLERLYESAKIRGWHLRIKKDKLIGAIEKTIQKNEFKESRVRVTITKGDEERPTLFIWVRKLEDITQSQYGRGVSAITFPLERPFPQLKTTSMQSLLIAQVEMRKRRVFEAILMNRRGSITEGTRTNVFIVKSKNLITPRVGVLLGTTRDHVLHIAKPLFHIQLREVRLQELVDADECFLTNAPVGIVPVVKVDGKEIGKGRSGKITRVLQREFEKVVI